MSQRNRRFSTLTFIALVCVGAVHTSRAGELPVPTPQETDRARQEIENVYKDRLAQPARAERIALAGDLLSESDRRAANAPLQYAMLCEARDVAAAAGDLQLAGRACERLAARFAVSLASQQCQMFAAAAGVMFGPDEQATFVTAAVGAAEGAMRHDDFDSARKLLALCVAAAKKAKSARLLDPVQWQQQALDAQERTFKRVGAALAATAAGPADPKSNLEAGSYLCFDDEDWDRGLPLLAKGSDPRLKALAAEDLQSPLGPDEQAALGERWAKYADAAGGRFDRFERRHVILRGYAWMQKAMPRLVGARAAQVDAKLRQLEPVVAQFSDMGAIWIAIRAALRQHTLVETKIAGGAFGKRTVREVPPEGALLVGFRLGMAKFVGNDTIGQFRAIYQTPQGFTMGQAYGASEGPFVECRARPGYAVGAVIVRGGGGMDALTVTFMKIVGDRLDPAQSYAVGPIGGTGGGERVFDGAGTPIVGLVAKDQTYVGLGVVFSTTPPTANGASGGAKRRASRGLDVTPNPLP